MFQSSTWQRRASGPRKSSRPTFHSQRSSIWTTCNCDILLRLSFQWTYSWRRCERMHLPCGLPSRWASSSQKGALEAHQGLSTWPPAQAPVACSPAGTVHGSIPKGTSRSCNTPACPGTPSNSSSPCASSLRPCPFREQSSISWWLLGGRRCSEVS